MSTVLIKPYVRKDEDSIGLSEIGTNRFPGTGVEYPVPIINDRFLTGYDKHAAYVAALPQLEREKELARIEQACDELDKLYPQYKICDCSVDNTFYQNLTINLSASSTVFDTRNILDIVRLSIIETYARYGVDSIIAADFEEALNSNKDYKYYISNEQRDIDVEANKDREMNNAISLFNNISENDKAKLLLIAKYLFQPSKSINFETDNKIYKRINDFIKGLVEDSKVKEATPANFIKVSNMSKDELICKILVKYAIYLNIVRPNKEKEFVYLKTGQSLGRTPEEIFNLLSNMKHNDLFHEIMEDVEKEVKIY